MESIDKELKAHLFICCRNRDDGKACCYSKGSEQWVSQLKEWIKSEGLKNQIKVSKSSCLGYCETGVTAVFYPQNQWYHRLDEEDLGQLKQVLLNYAK